MNVVVLINGREAIPVRAIPHIADSTVSADILVRGLLCTKDGNPFHKLSAYELLEYECSWKVSAVEWRRVAVKLHALSDTLRRRELKGELTHAEGTAEWKRESVKRLPAGVYVWKDEFFKEHFERFRRLSNEELSQLHRDALEMRRELASASDDSYTAELMAASGAPENWRETFQAQTDQANEEEPFNPGDYCVYVPNTCAPKETDTLSDVTFSPLIEGDERLVIMDGFEHVPKASPKREEEQSGLLKAGEAVQILAKWFGKPIDELPSYPRKIAEAYVPGWPKLSPAEQRARADEADHQVQATLGYRFEQANSEKEQAKNDPKQVAEELVAWYAVTLDAMTWWGLGSVTPREAAMLLCRFNPHDDELDPLVITTVETAPDDFKRLLRVFEDVEQGQSQARTLIDWHEVARNRRLKYHSWIDAFRQAITDTTQQVPAEAQGQSDAVHSGAIERAGEEVTPDDKKTDLWKIKAREMANGIWLRKLSNCQKPSKEGIAPEIARRLWDEKTVTKRGNRIEAGYIVRFALREGWIPPEPD